MRSNHIGRIAKWGTILGAFDIKYMPRTAIKGQILAELVAEFIECLEGVVAEKDESVGEQITAITIPDEPIWKLFMDGAANQRGSEVGIVLVSPKGITIEKSLRIRFSTTNNEAEYEALLIRWLWLGNWEVKL